MILDKNYNFLKINEWKKYININYKSLYINTLEWDVLIYDNDFKITNLKNLNIKKWPNLIWKKLNKDFHFDLNSFILWIWFDKWLSPDESKIVWYIKKNDIEKVRKFVKIENYKNLYFFELKNINIDNIDKFLSFITWISLIYWKFEIKNDYLINIKINLPKKNNIEDLIIRFSKYQILIKIFWNNIMIEDEEILEFIIKNLNLWYKNLNKEKNILINEKLKKILPEELKIYEYKIW